MAPPKATDLDRWISRYTSYEMIRARRVRVLAFAGTPAAGAGVLLRAAPGRDWQVRNALSCGLLSFYAVIA
jgi:hypothetical protein